MKNELLFPMALYVFFMGVIAAYMFLGRVNAVRKGVVKAKFYRAQIGETPPEAIVVVGRHYDNQFKAVSSSALVFYHVFGAHAGRSGQ